MTLLTCGASGFGDSEMRFDSFQLNSGRVSLSLAARNVVEPVALNTVEFCRALVAVS